MKILFVDDEPAILRTVKRTLRKLPRDDQVDLEGDPAAAMKRMEDTRYDLVVSDMRMPGISGHQVLEQAARVLPASVRAVLSGYSGEEETARAMRHAHLFIGKPFEPQAITGLVERARVLSGMPLSDLLRRRLGALRALPPIPKLVASLNKALEDEAHAPSLTEVAAILGRDMSMTAKVLQLANSAFFTGNSKTLSLEQAVKLLGTRMISAMVLQHELFSKASLSPELEEWRCRLNQESLSTAELAGRIAKHNGMSGAQREEAYLGGLFHDLGRLLLAAEEVPDGAAASHFLENLHGSELCREEEALFGAHHGWAGAYLLRLWGFSKSIVDAVAWHHHPSRSGIQGVSILTVVHAADALLSTRRGNPRELDREYLQQVGCLDESDAWSALGGDRG